MPQSRVPLTKIIYACFISTALLILALMAYVGMFDGLGDTLIEIVKPIAKFFVQ